MSEHCEHPHFMADVDVNRLTDGDDGPVHAFAADVRINCAACGLRFVFLCPDGGVLPDRPATSFDGAEIHLPLVPADRPEMRSEIGFRISASDQVGRKRQA